MERRLTGDTHTARQTPTKTGAVAWYVDIPIGNTPVTVLTNNYKALRETKLNNLAELNNWSRQAGRQTKLSRAEPN